LAVGKYLLQQLDGVFTEVFQGEVQLQRARVQVDGLVVVFNQNLTATIEQVLVTGNRVEQGAKSSKAIEMPKFLISK
jgi:hypothetical protein